MINESIRVAYEVRVEDRDQALARFIRAVAKYDCAITDSIGTTFVLRINAAHVARFEADAGPESMRYRAPVRFAFGRLVPIYSSPEEEVLGSVEEPRTGSN